MRPRCLDGASERPIGQNGERAVGDNPLGSEKPRRGGHGERGATGSHLYRPHTGQPTDRGLWGVPVDDRPNLIDPGGEKEARLRKSAPDRLLPGLRRSVASVPLPLFRGLGLSRE